MSLRNKFFSILAVTIGIVGFSTFTLAQDSRSTTPAPENGDRHAHGQWNHDKGERGGYGHGGDMMRMMQDLNLTEAQQTQIHSIMETNKPDQATMDEIRTLGQAKRDGTITAAQQERLSTLWSQSKEKREAVHQQVLAVLTPDQLAKLEQKKQERKQRHEQHERQNQPNPSTQDN